MAAWSQTANVLANPIHKAKVLAERKNELIRKFGECILKELQLLCHWAKNPIDQRRRTDFYSRLLMLLMLYEDEDNQAS